MGGRSTWLVCVLGLLQLLAVAIATSEVSSLRGACEPGFVEFDGACVPEGNLPPSSPSEKIVDEEDPAPPFEPSLDQPGGDIGLMISIGEETALSQ